MLLTNPKHHVFDYTRMMLAGLYLQPRPARILVIGLGGGTIPKTLQLLYPKARIDVAEIDPAVVNVARKYFGFRSGGTMRVFAQDGRVFVKRQAAARAKYDIVMLDAFDGDYIPEHLLTVEFLREVRSIMAPGAVIVANTFSSSGLYQHESATYRAVFGAFYNMKSGSRVVVGRLGGLPTGAAVRTNAAALEPALRQFGVSQGALLPKMSTRVDWNLRTRVLTDQYSPSNILNAK